MKESLDKYIFVSPSFWAIGCP